MAQPRQAEPQERRPPEIRVPTLTREETERRATRAFDASRDAVVRSLNRPPPAAEMTALRRLVDAAVRNSSPGETVDITPIITQYASDHPDSTIARNLRLTGGSTEWLFNGDRFGFNSSAFATALNAQINAAKQNVVTALVNLNNPRNRSNEVPTRPIAPELMAAMQPQLSTQLGGGRNQLPATVEWRPQPQQLYFATLLPPPPQEVNF